MKRTYPYFIIRTLALILATIFMNSNFIFAQGVLHVDWQSKITNANGASEKVLTEIEASNGSAFVAGYSSTENGQRMYVARYSSNGTIDWEVNLPSEFKSEITRLVMSDDGDLYVAGEEQDLTTGSPPIHYARLTQEGEVIWHLTFDRDGSKEVELTWMEVVNDHIFMIGSEMGKNEYDVAWAAEFDLDGNLNWKTAFDPGTNTVFTDISVNNNGTVAACGWANYGYSYLLVGFDENGMVNWQFPEIFAESSEQWFNDLSSDSEGNWIAVGSEETGSFSEYDAVTYKFDSGGNELWNQHFNNGFENYASLVEVKADGSIITFVNMEMDFDRLVRTISYDAGGNEQWATNYTIEDNTNVINATTSNTGEIYIGVQDFDFAAIVKLSATGQVLSTRKYEETVYDYLGDIAFDGDNVFACGYSRSDDLSIVISLTAEDLEEVYAKSSTGIPSSDVQVGAIASNGANIWLTNTSFQGSVNVFTVIKMDYSGNILWSKDKQHAGSNPVFENFTVDASGNSIGFYESLISGGVTELGLIKYDPDGNEIFYTVYDSSATLYAGAVTTDPGNNIYVGGYNQTSKLMFVSKSDPNGNEIWTVNYSSPSSTFPYAEPKKMVVSEQGKLVIGAIHKNADNVNNLYLFQYDSNGNLEWQKEVVDQAGNTCFLYGFDVNEEGAITVFGTSGPGKYVAANFNASGEQLWIDAGESGTAVSPRSMAIDNNDNTYLCFSSPTDARFKKLNAFGTAVASKAHVIPSSGSFFLPLGSAFLDGKLAVIGDHTIGSNSFPFEMVLDDELNFLSGRIDSLNQGDFRAMTVDEANKIHAAFTQGDIFGGPGFRAALVRQYSIGTLGIKAMKRYDNLIRIYPNPASDHINISASVDLPKIKHISLFDMNGKIVQEFGQNFQISSNQTIMLDLPPGLKHGNYILNVLSADALYTARLVKW